MSCPLQNDANKIFRLLIFYPSLDFVKETDGRKPTAWII